MSSSSSNVMSEIIDDAIRNSGDQGISTKDLLEKTSHISDSVNRITNALSRLKRQDIVFPCKLVNGCYRYFPMGIKTHPKMSIKENLGNVRGKLTKPILEFLQKRGSKGATQDELLKLTKKISDKPGRVHDAIRSIRECNYEINCKNKVFTLKNNAVNEEEEPKKEKRKYVRRNDTISAVVTKAVWSVEIQNQVLANVADNPEVLSRLILSPSFITEQESKQ